ncbi:MAG: tetratricopeptide repeat protein [Roseburia sp.]|nr:tetratricopeptide repeat protein [Roseburia sp.]
MKCVKCGAELKEGCLYCSVCGQESQILPDYGVLEDEYLRSILQAEDKQTDQIRTSDRKAPKRQDAMPKKQAASPKKSSWMPIVAVCCLLAVVIIVAVSVKVSINNKNANSYDYQVQMAEKELVDHNYENALNYYKRALTIQTNDIAVRMAMADIYINQNEYDSAMVLLMEVIEKDPKNSEAYRRLINIYEKKEDYDSIVELARGVEDTAILELFAGYIVAAPVISPDEGEYDDILMITLFSVDEDNIYYTLDGSVPSAENGILYSEEEKIQIQKDGIYELQAVCCNEKGIYSATEKSVFTVKLAPPEYPTVTPDGGRMSEETFVTIEAEPGCNIYYTWDGTDPTELSERYEIPIQVPEGNTVLSVLVVDRETGLNSGVYRTNFIYYP